MEVSGERDAGVRAEGPVPLPCLVIWHLEQRFELSTAPVYQRETPVFGT